MTVTGGDFDVPAEFELVNPEQVICTLADGAHLTMTMRIGTGRGYVSGEDNERDERSHWHHSRGLALLARAPLRQGR